MLNKITLMFSLLLLLNTPVLAERVLIPGHYNVKSNIVMPRRGIKMNQVLKKFGEPDVRKPAVGQPPITEWDYPQFRVYFEYDTVLHSVDLSTLIMPE